MEIKINDFSRFKNELEEDKKKLGCVSYATLCKMCFTDMILCNNILDVDASIWDNMEYFPENDEDYYPEIYQYYLVEKDSIFDEFIKNNLMMSYSDLLNVYVLCVTHFGMSWSAIPTNIKIIE